MMYTSSCCIQPISENLALMPYMLRSIRIRKMFDARDISCKAGRIPKDMIQAWSERRLLIGLQVYMIFMFFAGFLVYFYIRTFYMFSNLSGVLNRNTGLFYPMDDNIKAMSGGAFIVCL